LVCVGLLLLAELRCNQLQRNPQLEAKSGDSTKFVRRRRRKRGPLHLL